MSVSDQIKEISPSEAIFLSHLNSPKYLLGEFKRWNVLDSNSLWPNIFIEIRSQDTKYHFRFNLDRYPAIAPAVTVWDIVKNCVASEELRPKQTPIQVQVFKIGWQNGTNIYHPMERISASHFKDVGYTEYYWNSEKHTIADFLEELYIILNP